MESDGYNYDNSSFGSASLDLQKEMDGGTKWRLTLMPNRGAGSSFDGNSIVHEASVSLPLGDLKTRLIAGQIPDWSGCEYLPSTQNKLITHNMLFDFTLPVAYTGAGVDLSSGKWISKIVPANMNASKPQSGERTPVIAYRVDYSRGDYQGFGFAGVHGKATNLRAADAAGNLITLTPFSTKDTAVNLYLHGVARGKFVPLNQLDLWLRDGVGFAGPSIWGTGLPRTGPRSEYYGRGNADTARALPWMPGYARIVCNSFVAGEPFDACPRQVLRRQIARLAERGWVLRTGIEPEFFLLRKTAEGYAPFDANDQLDKPSYDLKSLPRQREFLKQLGDGLTACGLDIFQADHEDAHGRFEVKFHHADALTSADHLMLFKMAAHELVEREGMVFSMMPKPFAVQPGSGMHFHVSMWDGDRAGTGDSAKCVFDNDSSDLSPLAHYFIAGVLHHSAALCALAAPIVNSYKRLTVGESISGTSWAPAYVAHGPNKRTALVRTLRGRFEWRVPDASANPYLATAALIAAGLDGIDRQLKLGPGCSEDLFKLSITDIRLRGIDVLPQSLNEAIDALQGNEVIADALGNILREQFCQLKRDEWTEYARHVSG